MTPAGTVAFIALLVIALALAVEATHEPVAGQPATLVAP
jgi:hypothetical protein